MALQKQSIPLNTQGVDQIADEVSAFLTNLKLDKRDILRMRLAVEEMALRIMERPGAPEELTLTTGKRFGGPLIALSFPGEAFDPTVRSADPEDWSDRILKNLGLEPSWSCRRGVNTVTIRPRKAGGAGNLLRVLIAVAAAFVLGVPGTLLPADIRDGLISVLLTPAISAFLGLVTTFAGLVVFTAVASSVFGIGDTGTLNRIGKATILRFFLTVFLVAAFAVVAVQPLLHFPEAEAAGGESQLSAISEMVFNILPKNPVRPILEGNMMQIIVLALFTGVALLILGERGRNICVLIEDCSVVVQMMMEQVCRLIPVFVFVSLLRMILSGNAEQLLSLWKPFCVCLLLYLPVTAALLLAACVRTKTSPGLLLRKVLPSTLIALTTASSMASYSACAEVCRKQLGLKKQLVDFALPIGIVTCMPGTVILFFAVPVCLAELYGVAANLSWFLMAGLLAAVLSIAAPPIPGSALTCYGIILAQLNIPTEAMLLAVALDVVMDYINTAVNVLDLQLLMTGLGDSLGMLDRERLHRKAM